MKCPSCKGTIGVSNYFKVETEFTMKFYKRCLKCKKYFPMKFIGDNTFQIQLSGAIS